MNFERLRALLLEQAIRGELVEQQARDSAVLVVDGVLPKESYPFEIPDHWKWYPLGKIVEYGKGTHIGSGEISETTWVLDLEDIEKGTGRLLNKKRGTPTTSNKTKFCGSSSKTPVAKPDGTKMFCSAFLNDARMCCFFCQYNSRILT